MALRSGSMFLASGLLLTSVLLAGCKSAFVETIVRNDTDRPVTLLEVDYPSASFARESLAAHAEFHYRFKILGSGATHVQWTDAGRHEREAKGPELHEGQRGQLIISLSDSTAQWTPALQ